jgi:hypothetical protein
MADGLTVVYLRGTLLPGFHRAACVLCDTELKDQSTRASNHLFASMYAAVLRSCITAS